MSFSCATCSADESVSDGDLLARNGSADGAAFGLLFPEHSSAVHTCCFHQTVSTSSVHGAQLTTSSAGRPEPAQGDVQIRMPTVEVAVNQPTAMQVVVRGGIVACIQWVSGGGKVRGDPGAESLHDHRMGFECLDAIVENLWTRHSHAGPGSVLVPVVPSGRHHTHSHHDLGHPQKTQTALRSCPVVSRTSRWLSSRDGLPCGLSLVLDHYRVPLRVVSVPPGGIVLWWDGRWLCGTRFDLS